MLKMAAETILLLTCFLLLFFVPVLVFLFQKDGVSTNKRVEHGVLDVTISLPNNGRARALGNLSFSDSVMNDIMLAQHPHWDDYLNNLNRSYGWRDGQSGTNIHPQRGSNAHRANAFAMRYQPLSTYLRPVNLCSEHRNERRSRWTEPRAAKATGQAQSSEYRPCHRCTQSSPLPPPLQTPPPDSSREPSRTPSSERNYQEHDDKSTVTYSTVASDGSPPRKEKGKFRKVTPSLRRRGAAFRRADDHVEG